MLIQPYLFFEGRCEEALEFYREKLGGEITMMLRYGESPEAGDAGAVPPGDGAKILHASLRIGEVTLLASDGDRGGVPDFKGFSLSITVKDGSEAERLMAAFSDGGQVEVPLIPTFFSSHFGIARDRFGVSWMISVAA